jgi:hypothetical protein
MSCNLAETEGMSGRADLHFHLLPGLDDGPADLADSIELARAAVAQGTAMVIATPHVRSDFVTDVADLRERVAELRLRLADARVPLAVGRGGELGHDMVPRLSQPELEAIAQGPPGARWMLLEAPWEPYGEDFHAAADELRERGFGVLIAHPERSADAELYACEGLQRERRLKPRHASARHDDTHLGHTSRLLLEAIIRPRIGTGIGDNYGFTNVRPHRQRRAMRFWQPRSRTPSSREQLLPH